MQTTLRLCIALAFRQRCLSSWHTTITPVHDLGQDAQQHCGSLSQNTHRYTELETLVHEASGLTASVQCAQIWAEICTAPHDVGHVTGDMWEEGEMMRLVKENMAFVGEDGRMPYENLLRVGQVRPELVVMDPNDS